MSAIIIGSGVAGSLIATALLEAGQGPVTVLEAGPPIPMSDPAHWFDVVSGGAAPYQACYDTAQDFQASGFQPWSIIGGRILGRGGTTLHFGGWLPRFKPEDFLYHTNTGKGLDWPFDYDALEPYYCLAESYFGTLGNSADQDPPRSKPYPYEAPPYPSNVGPFLDALNGEGMSHTFMPLSRYGAPHFGQAACRTTGTCKYCPIGARFTGNQPLDALDGRPGFELISNAPVNGIVMSAKNTVAAVIYTDTTTGRRHRLEADRFFLCAGAFETPKLLQRSTSSFWTKGIGNDTELVGRYLMASPYFFANGTLPANPDKLQQELGFPSLCSRHFDTPEYQPEGKFFFNADYALPNAPIASGMANGKTPDEIAAGIVGQATLSLQGTMAAIPQHDNWVSNGPGTTRFGLPTTRISTPDPIYDVDTSKKYIETMSDLVVKAGCTVGPKGGYPQRGDHAMSTTRMAADESQGVVGSDLRVFGVDNLHIAGLSVFPSMGAANPTLTLVALILKWLDQEMGIPPSVCQHVDSTSTAESGPARG